MRKASNKLREAAVKYRAISTAHFIGYICAMDQIFNMNSEVFPNRFFFIGLIILRIARYLAHVVLSGLNIIMGNV